jgi:hypothetical protein
MEIPRDAVLLRVFFGEDDRHDQMPLYEAVVLKAREMQLGGATVLRNHGVWTFEPLAYSEDLAALIRSSDCCRNRGHRAEDHELPAGAGGDDE